MGNVVIPPMQTPRLLWDQHEELDSTQNRAMELLRCSPPPPRPFIVTAQRQTRGRGRGGNHWYSSDGALTTSLVVDTVRENMPLLGILMAIAVAETAEDELPTGKTVGLRWPNDVLVGGAKLAGILIESPAPTTAIIGVGVNVNNPVGDVSLETIGQVATSMCELLGGDTTNMELFLQKILKRFFAGLAEFPNTQSVLERFRRRCVQIGHPTTIRQGKDTVSGYCTGITEHGELMLMTDTGRYIAR